MWMNAGRVMFLRAEAALRGWDTEKTPKAYYEAGIRLSSNSWSRECRRLPGKH